MTVPQNYCGPLNSMCTAGGRFEHRVTRRDISYKRKKFLNNKKATIR